jgi:phosphoribosyl 1,2-cyclic phosphate phosphodiesterase
MKLLYLGTAAAEGIPALFCTCPICLDAQKRGGKALRTRSQALVDKTLLLDFPPDTLVHYQRFREAGFDLPAVRHIFITHSHRDHFFPDDLDNYQQPYARQPLENLHIYGNKSVEAGFNQTLPNALKPGGKLSFHPAIPFTPIVAEGYRVTPLLAKHSSNEECLIYTIENQGKALLYAHDTGWFPDPTWEYLESAKLFFNLVSLDCTSMRHTDGSYHMGLPDVTKVRDRLLSTGLASGETVFVLNHFSHNGDMTFDELEAAAGKEDFQVSHDGREFTV